MHYLNAPLCLKMRYSFTVPLSTAHSVAPLSSWSISANTSYIFDKKGYL